MSNEQPGNRQTFGPVIDQKRVLNNTMEKEVKQRFQTQSSVAVSQEAQHCDPEDEAAIIHFPTDTCHSPAVTSQEAADVNTITTLLITDSDNSKLDLQPLC